MRFHFILACHNRRETTHRALSALFAACSRTDALIDVTVYDDGSQDGTSESIRSSFPAVNILHGDGSAYWAQSMYRAEKYVLETLEDKTATADGFYVVWLNDDVILDNDAVERCVALTEKEPNAIIACAVRDPQSAEVTYAGYSKRSYHPLQLNQRHPSTTFEPIDTFNGNFVLVPGRIARRLKSIDGGYSHALADIDYGYRARLAHIAVLLAPGTYGTCPRNVPTSHSSINKAWRAFVGPKGGGNPASLVKILRLGSPKLWPIFFISTFTLWWLRALRHRLAAIVTPVRVK